MQEASIIMVVVLTASMVVISVYAFKTRVNLVKITKKYSGVYSAEKELERITVECKMLKEETDRLTIKSITDAAKEKETIDYSIEQLRTSYKSKKEIYDSLVNTISIYDDQVQLIELGLYNPHYEFDTSEEYKLTIEDVRQRQKEMISAKTAIICRIEWTMNNSKTQGQTMTNRGIRLTARAFNNECEAAIANTRWNNAAKMEQRIIKAFETINKLNESSKITVTHDYLVLKLSEFRLAFEYQEKKQQEKEEQAAIRQQLREEERLIQDAEKAFKEEESYQKLLIKAKKESEKATGDKLDELEKIISELTADLAAAHEKSERAKSMAEQTKAGHIYVISNIGSFGEDVYKIGMTRRLEPSERVYELGNASVPFVFDIHAMIYSEDAPALENKLHKIFNEHRINLVNTRKEFFKVPINKIKLAIEEQFPDASFVLMPEARQYHETKLLRANNEQQAYKLETIGFPATI